MTQKGGALCVCLCKVMPRSFFLFYKNTPLSCLYRILLSCTIVSALKSKYRARLMLVKSLFTSVFEPPPHSKPPFRRSLPPTIDALAPASGRGRGAREVHAVASSPNVNTEEYPEEDPSYPPATRSACRFEK